MTGFGIPLSGKEISDAIVQSDKIGYFDTLAEFKASTKVYNRVFISGYYDANDGAFGSNNHYLLPDDGTAYEEIGGVVVQTASNRWYRLKFEKLFPEYFGAIKDNGLTTIATSNAIAINSAVDYDVTYLKSGTYYCDDTIVVTKHGLIGEDGYNSVLRVADNFSTDDTIPLVTTAGADNIILDNFRVFGNSKQNIGLSIKGLNYANATNRSSYGRLYAYNFALGIDLDGWINDVGFMLSTGCSQGYRITRPNGCHFSLISAENCKQYIELTTTSEAEGAGGFTIDTMIFEGSTDNFTNEIPSTIDGIEECTINNIYLEGGSATSSGTVFKIGENSKVSNLRMNNIHSAHSVLPSVSPLGCVFEVFNANRIEFDGKIHQTTRKEGIYVHKDLATNIIDNTIKTYGYKNSVRPNYNYIPNGDLSGGLIVAPDMRFDVGTSESITTSYVTDEYSDNCIKIIADTDLKRLHVSFVYSGSHSNLTSKILGKRIMAQVDIKSSMPDTLGQCLEILLVGGANDTMVLNSSYSPDDRLVNEYQTVQKTTDYVVENDRTDTWVNIYFTITRLTIPSGTEFYIKNIFLGELFESKRTHQKDYIQAKGLGIEPNGENLLWTSTPSTNVDTYHRQGDKYLYPDPATSGYIGKVCTADGQAFADWSNYGALA